MHIDSYEKWKKYQKHYRAWKKLPEAEHRDFECSHEHQRRQYKQVDAALHRWQADGEKIDYKGWNAAVEHF